MREGKTRNLIEYNTINTDTRGAVPSAPQNEPIVAPQTQMVPRIIKWFKRITNQKIGFAIWQRSYHDHVIRNEEEYWNVYQYMQSNPIEWLKR